MEPRALSSQMWVLKTVSLLYPGLSKDLVWCLYLRFHSDLLLHSLQGPTSESGGPQQVVSVEPHVDVGLLEQVEEVDATVCLCLGRRSSLERLLSNSCVAFDHQNRHHHHQMNGLNLGQNKGPLNGVPPAKTCFGNDLGVVIPA